MRIPDKLKTLLRGKTPTTVAAPQSSASASSSATRRIDAIIAAARDTRNARRRS